MLHGFIDLVDAARVVGWGAHDGGVAPELTVLIDGQPVGRITPTLERTDLKALFPNNINLGFCFRMPCLLTQDATIAVVDSFGRHLTKSPYRFRLPKTEWLDTGKRAALAAHYLKGSGIEVGALHEPLTVPAHVTVRYVDRMSRADLLKQYPELENHPLVEPDIISNGETLEGIADHSCDFVIANHFIEHTQDPIATLKTFVRVLHPGGIVFMAVPDKRWSFDKDRALTPFAHLQRDHEQGPQSSRDQHFAEWVRHVEKVPDAQIERRVTELKAIDYSIHFHVWDALTFLGFLSDAKSLYRIPIELCTATAGRDELIVVLRKTESSEADGAVSGILHGLQSKPASVEADMRYDMRPPAASNALDLFQGQWSAAVPGYDHGTAPLTESPHVKFFEQEIGGFAGKRILELGPLEASHTYVMSKAGAAHILAIEANKLAYLKCLVIKELLSIQNVDFQLGDFCSYLAGNPQRFDAILASGVLYHMSDPLGLIEGAAKAADSIGVWTHYFDAARIRIRPDLSQKFDASPQIVSFHGRSIELHTQRYLDATEWAGFCGGSSPTSVWLTKDGILSAFDTLGFEVVIGGDQPDHPNGPAFWFVARKQAGRVSAP